jgi:hypothetical protein
VAADAGFMRRLARACAAALGRHPALITPVAAALVHAYVHGAARAALRAAAGAEGVTPTLIGALCDHAAPRCEAAHAYTGTAIVYLTPRGRHLAAAAAALAAASRDAAALRDVYLHALATHLLGRLLRCVRGPADRAYLVPSALPPLLDAARAHAGDRLGPTFIGLLARVLNDMMPTPAPHMPPACLEALAAAGREAIPQELRAGALEVLEGALAAAAAADAAGGGGGGAGGRLLADVVGRLRGAPVAHGVACGRCGRRFGAPRDRDAHVRADTAACRGSARAGGE